MPSAFYNISSKGLILKVRVIPNSSKSGIAGIYTDSNNEAFLKINLNAIPEKGKANKELIAFLSKTLKYSKSSFSIISGETDRNKKILLNAELSEQLQKKLDNLENANDSSNH